MAEDDIEVGGSQAVPDDGASPQGGQVQEPSDTVQQPVEPTIKDVLEQLKAVQSHVGRISNLQSRLDSMPKTFDEMVSKKLDGVTRQFQLNQLPPEQRQQYEQEQAQRDSEMEYLKKLIGEQIKSVIPTEFGPLIEAGKAQEDRKMAQGFFGDIGSALGPEDTQRIMPFLGQLLQDNKKGMDSKNPDEVRAAEEWLDRALKSPATVALQALRMAQASVKESGEQVVQQREQRGKALAASPRTGSGPIPAKSLKGLNSKQLDDLAASMSTADFEKLVQESKR